MSDQLAQRAVIMCRHIYSGDQHRSVEQLLSEGFDIWGAKLFAAASEGICIWGTATSHCVRNASLVTDHVSGGQAGAILKTYKKPLECYVQL